MRIDATSFARRDLTPDLRARIEAADPRDGRCWLWYANWTAEAIIFDRHDARLSVGAAASHTTGRTRAEALELAFLRAMSALEAREGTLA